MAEKSTSKSTIAKPIASKPGNGKYIAAIRLRGGMNIHIKVKNTLDKLNLRNQHNLIIFDDTPSRVGMLKIAKDYLTWGEISPELKAEVESKKSETTMNGKPKKYYRLNPPRGGYERGGIKVSFSQGGALGERNNMDKLLRKML